MGATSTQAAPRSNDAPARRHHRQGQANHNKPAHPLNSEIQATSSQPRGDTSLRHALTQDARHAPTAGASKVGWREVGDTAPRVLRLSCLGRCHSGSAFTRGTEPSTHPDVHRVKHFLSPYHRHRSTGAHPAAVASCAPHTGERRRWKAAGDAENVTPSPGGGYHPFHEPGGRFRPSCGHSQAMAWTCAPPRQVPARMRLHNQPQRLHSTSQ